MLVVLSQSSLAEGGWLTARGKLQSDARIEGWGGTRSLGAGVVLPDSEPMPTAVAFEVAWAHHDRNLTLDGARVWQLTPSGLAMASFSLGGAVHLVPEGFDLGIGPHAGLSLSIGGPRFSLDLGVQTGAEAFLASLQARFPQRAVLGLSVRIGAWAMGLQGRIGADVLPGRGFVLRDEAMVSLSYFGLERLKSSPPASN
jgi:hypothetical protein